MIISKTPFRISLFGGGTDFPEYYNKYKGRVLGFAINKYCNIFFREGNKLMDYNYRIAYSKIEMVKSINQIDHPSVKNTSKYFNIKFPFDLLHNGDLPARTGLGSSSSFTVGMCNIFRYHQKKYIDPYVLANDAIKIEQNYIKESVGSQDQIFAAFGGFNTIVFDKKNFYVNRHFLSEAKQMQIQKQFLLMYTGITRYAEKIEKSKVKNLEAKLNYYDNLKNLARLAEIEFNEKVKIDPKNIGEMLHDAWILKKALSKNVSNNWLDSIYEKAIKNGAYGGKLLGAGGGGFFLFIVDEKKVVKFKKKFNKFHFIDYKISNIGSHIIL